MTMRLRREAISSMAPKDRLYLAYDLVWKAANDGDGERVLQLLMLLRKAVHFDERDPLIALNALRLYRHCEALIGKDDFPAVAHVFFELKRALSSAEVHPDTPEENERREEVRKAQGVLYFGQHGTHYGPNPKGGARVRRQGPGKGR